MERKVIALSDIAADGDEKEMRFKGYGAVFGNIDSYGDVIEQGAFAKTLQESEKTGQWPAMLLQHGGWGVTSTDMTPIGVWDILAENGTGLKSEGILAATPRGVEAYTLMKMKPRPAITGLSIGYVPKKFTLGTKPNEPRRLLHEVDLLEISLVTFPANGKARVTSVKSGEFTERDFERLLTQDAGLSRSEARVVINQGFKSLIAMRDAGSSELADLAEKLKARAVF
jgi:HK97 family phage prohead protease